MKAIKFYNWTDEDFICKWDGQPYTFVAGTGQYFEYGQAHVFARHLAIEQMNKKGIPHGNLKIYDDFMARGLVTDSAIEAETKAALTAEMVKAAQATTKNELEIIKDVKEETEETTVEVEVKDRCEECDKTFASAQGLKVHNAKMHPKEEEEFEDVE